MTLTAATVEYLLALARQWCALVFIVKGYQDQPMALLMPWPLAMSAEPVS